MKALAFNLTIRMNEAVGEPHNTQPSSFSVLGVGEGLRVRQALAVAVTGLTQLTFGIPHSFGLVPLLLLARLSLLALLLQLVPLLH